MRTTLSRRGRHRGARRRLFDALVRAAALPVIVDFWAPWCGPCRMVAPELERVAADNAGRYLVVKVNTDAVPELGERFRIRSIPTMAVFEGGREVARTSGARPAADIERFVRQSVDTAQKRVTGAPREPAGVPAALRGFGEFALERFRLPPPRPSQPSSRCCRRPLRGSMPGPSTIFARRSLRRSNSALSHLLPAGLGDTTPRVSPAGALPSRRGDPRRLRRLPARAAIKASSTRRAARDPARHARRARQPPEDVLHEREVRFRDAPFQGKGFRSLGQEAIYAAGIRLRRGETYRTAAGWTGDVVAPIIRDLGAALAMRPSPETVRMVLSAQMAKAGPPMDGKDLHVGDFDRDPAGVCAARHRHADARRNGAGVSARGLGAGGDLLHRRRRRLARRMARGHQPVRRAGAIVFCLENNQTALSTPVREQAACVCSRTRPRLRHSRHHDRRHRRRRDRRGGRMGGRAGGRSSGRR